MRLSGNGKKEDRNRYQHPLRAETPRGVGEPFTGQWIIAGLGATDERL